ncbi:hypothetical protein E2P81_ATG07885 [Venturia nashicola]|uniref:Uncharacterized protein n=1 Tax=Venturia nashicola TaxID=86259 RepID=A0A4Z1NRM7_9PEZI|nr:hypothetical protein E6O75_ATG08055 [Venturia nashicola]TLD22692.1 hypothetical protein E2P81_ATG07885 [Venturia nashicola]
MANVIASLFPFVEDRYRFVKTLIDDVCDTERFVLAKFEWQPPSRWSRETTATPEGDESEIKDFREINSL